MVLYNSGSTRNAKTIILYMTCAIISSFVFILLILYVLPLTKTCEKNVKLQLNNTTGCNRHNVLCTRRYNNVSFATLHNAYAVSCSGFLFYNQHKSIDLALVSGARAFMLDIVATSSSEIYLCHGSCSLGMANISDVLDTFGYFMQKNPREVVTLIWEIHDSKIIDKRDVKRLWHNMVTKSRISKFIFTPNFVFHLRFPINYYAHEYIWPTLQDMIDSNERVVIFSDKYVSMHPYESPKWDMFLYWFVLQTKWNILFSSDLQKPCSLTGTSERNTAVNSKKMLIVNNFAKDDSIMQYIHNKIRYADSITKCASNLNLNPVFPAVDFWDVSNIFNDVDVLNKIPR